MNSQQNDYEAIIRPVEQQTMRAVWRITQDATEAEEAFHDAVAQIWKKLPRIRTHPNPQALVLRICMNVACDSVRRKTRRGLREQPLEAGLAAAAPDVVAVLLKAERKEQVKAAISQLPENQATAVSMRFLLDCSYDEIAQALECAAATARVHVARGLERLRTLLPHF